MLCGEYSELGCLSGWTENVCLASLLCATYDWSG